jgi:cytochrome P450 family 135
MALPPGPRLPPTLQSLLVYARPVGWIESCRRRYGDVFTLREKVMGPMVCVADPRAVKSVFKGDRNVFRATPTPLESVLGPTSVVFTDGASHLRTRRLMQPSFHGSHVEHYSELTASATRRDMERWPLDTPFRLSDRTEAITLDVMLQALFGGAARHFEELRELTPRLLAPNPAVFIEPLRRDLGQWSPWGKFLRVLDAYERLVYDEIAQRRALLAGRSGSPNGDMLSLLLAARDEDGQGLTDRELRDQLITVLVAGSEAVATGVDWAFERLLRHPQVLERLRAELEAGDEAYLEAVVRETLRLRPPVMAATRTLTEDVELGGYELPAGTVLMVSVALVHRSPDDYPEPDRFRPERFLGGDPQPFAWIGFGGGAHRCIGSGFASVQMKVMIATILKRAELAAPDPKDERITTSGPILKPAKGVRVVLKERR